MNPLEKLEDTLRRQKKKGIAVISNDYVLGKLKEHRKIEYKDSERLV
ncbi:hypothetical protein [Paenibacillus sp. L3-i20]|nr:hypothetical protein [Paenibacillus sp. L3-i20]GKU76865.1 hypothetical protein L3i20_v212620 [Paenibacillus sp. L3-i20]